MPSSIKQLIERFAKWHHHTQSRLPSHPVPSTPTQFHPDSPLQVIEEVNKVIQDASGGSHPRLAPEEGNVVFASAMLNWSFTLESFGSIYADTYPGVPAGEPPPPQHPLHHPNALLLPPRRQASTSATQLPSDQMPLLVATLSVVLRRSHPRPPSMGRRILPASDTNFSAAGARGRWPEDVCSVHPRAVVQVDDADDIL